MNMARLNWMIVSLMCVAVSFLEASRYSSTRHIIEERNRYDEGTATGPAEPQCDPSCGPNSCCVVRLPLLLYVCEQATGTTCHEDPEKCKQCLPNECCVKTMRKGQCSMKSSTRCLNPSRLAVSSTCCPVGKVCQAGSSKNSLFGICKEPAREIAAQAELD